MESVLGSKARVPSSWVGCIETIVYKLLTVSTSLSFGPHSFSLSPFTLLLLESSWRD